MVLSPHFRFVDVRREEVVPLVRAFAMLFLIVGAHTILETARDALIITQLPASTFGLVYTALAICVLPAAALAARSARVLGPHRSFATTLVIFSLAVALLFLVPLSRALVITIYVVSGLVGAVLLPQFWSYVASVFTVAQGRRLVSPLGLGGILGGTLGSLVAAQLLDLVSAKALLLVSSGVMALAAIALAVAPAPAPTPPDAAVGEIAPPVAALRREPFLPRIALLTVVSTATLVTLDYYFKWTVAAAVPSEHVARFVARYYAFCNVAALAVQIFVSGELVRRIGIVRAIAVTPFLLLSGAAYVVVSGGALLAVLILKGLDGALRNPVHRVAMELIYLPVPESARGPAKPLIEGVAVRATQGIVGALLYGLAERHWLSAGALNLGVMGLAAAWLVVGWQTRRPYLGLLRRAMSRVLPRRSSSRPEPLDLDSFELLVRLLAHQDPLIVVGAMSALVRRGGDRFIPALILFHTHERVLIGALQIFATSRREDWVPRARLLLGDTRAAVRMAALRALAMHGRLDVPDTSQDPSEEVRAYAAVFHALATPSESVLDHPTILAFVDAPGQSGEENRLALLAAVADAPQDARLSHLLRKLADGAPPTVQWTERLARAAATQRGAFMIPLLISRLTLPQSREAVGAALLSLEGQAMDAIEAALQDPALAREVRIQLPNALARFGSKRAAGRLLEIVETDDDGRVRYGAIRGLGRLFADNPVPIDRPRVERLAHANIVEHLRLLPLRAAFETDTPAPAETMVAPTGRLLVRLLDDKLRQALERAFRLLQIAYPKEDFRRLYIASISSDKRARAMATEFLDTLLGGRRHNSLRRLLGVVLDDVPLASRAARSALLTGRSVPATNAHALAVLIGDADPMVASLAKLHVAALAGESASVVIRSRDGLPLELSTKSAHVSAAAVVEHSHA